MKKFLLLFVFLASTFALSAQANYFFPTEEGTVLTYKNFNAKGKVDKDIPWYKYIISKVEKKGNSTHVFFTMDWPGKEKMGKDEADIFNNLEVRIEDNVMHIEFFNAIVGKLTAMSMSKVSSSDVSITTEGNGATIFPLNPEVGQTIPDVEFKVIVKTNVQGFSMTANTTTRSHGNKITAKEDLDTPAGTFSCYKIAGNTEVTLDLSMMKKSFAEGSSIWLAKGVGFVKSESYDEKGKLKSYMLLDKIEKK